MSPDPACGGSGANVFTDILTPDARDSLGRRFVAGHIESCRDWKATHSLHAFRYYAHYLYEDLRNEGRYDELWSTVAGEFGFAKASAVGSVFPLLEDVDCVIQAAKAKRDLERYGASLVLRGQLWRFGAFQVSAGSVKALARTGRFEEAVASARSARQPIDALYLVLDVLEQLDSDDAERISDVAEAALGCVKSLDNEGTRAHHVHRVVYAVRQKSERVALQLVPDCRLIVSDISDDFQRVTAGLLLVQQVATLDLDIAEELCRTVWSDAFVAESMEMALVIAGVGRGTEPSTDRLARLERLLELVSTRAKGRTGLTASLGLLREIAWEHRTISSFATLVDRIVGSLEGFSAAAVRHDLLKMIFTPDPIPVSHASGAYRRGDEGSIGVIEQRDLAALIRVFHDRDDQVVDIVGRMVDAVLAKTATLDAPDERYQVAKELASCVRKLAAVVKAPVGSRLLEHLEAGLGGHFAEVESLLLSIELATGWYQVSEPIRAGVLLEKCVAHVHDCRTQLEGLKEADSSETSLLSAYAGLFKGLGRALEARLGLGKKYEDTEAELIQKHKDWVRRALAEALREIPLEYRLEACKAVVATLEYGSDDATSCGAEAAVACALADVDVGLAIRTVDSIEDTSGRARAAAQLADVVGCTDCRGAAALLDAINRGSQSRVVAGDICGVVAALHSCSLPLEFWRRLARELPRLTECEDRRLAAQMCAVRIAHWSPGEARTVADSELETCSDHSTENAVRLRLFSGFLKLVDGVGTDVQALLSESRARPQALGGATKAFVCDRVVPDLAATNPAQAIEMLEAIGELAENISALAEIIARLLEHGHSASATRLMSGLPEAVSAMPGDKRATVFQELFPLIAVNRRLRGSATESEFWQWCRQHSSVFADGALTDAIEHSYVLYMAGVDLDWAVPQWHAMSDPPVDFTRKVISRAVNEDSVRALKLLASLPDGPRKAAGLCEAYACPALTAGGDTDLPSPLPLLQYMGGDQVRGALLGNYIRVMPEQEFDRLTQVLGELEATARREPLSAMVERFGSSRKGVLLDFVLTSFKAWRLSIDVGSLDEEGTSDGDSDEELCEWAGLVGRLSFERGVEILSTVGNSFQKYCGATQLLRSMSDITPAMIVTLLNELDEANKSKCVRDAVATLARHNTTMAEAVATTFNDVLDASDCASMRWVCQREGMRRDIDLALQEAQTIIGRKAQVDRVTMIVELLSDAPEPEGLSVTRWDRLLSIMESWIESVEGHADFGDFDDIEAIAPFAPDVARARMLLKPPDERRSAASRRLLDAIAASHHLCLLDLVISGYRDEFDARRKERTDTYSIALNTFLVQLQERVATWSSTTVDVAAPMLSTFLEELPEGGSYRSAVVCELLKRSSLNSEAVVERMLRMMDSAETWNQAVAILAGRLPEDRLRLLIQREFHRGATIATPASVATAILAGAMGKTWGSVLAGAVPVDIAYERDTEALALLGAAYAPLWRLSPCAGEAILAKILALLDRVVTPQDPRIDYPLLLREVKERCAGLDADAAGEVVGGLVVSAMSLGAETRAAAIETIAIAVGTGDRACSVPALVQGRFHGSDAWRFIGSMFASIGGCQGDFRDLVNRCVAPLVESTQKGADSFGELFVLAKGQRLSATAIGRCLAAELVSVAEMRARQDDSYKRLVPVIRLVLAPIMFLQEAPLESSRALRSSVNDAIAYLRESDRDAGDVAWMTTYVLTHLGAFYGRVLFHRRSDLATLAGIEPYAWNLLLWLAIERREAVETEDRKKIALKYLSEVRKELIALEGVVRETLEERGPGTTVSGVFAACRRLQRRVKYAPVNAVRRSEIKNLVENLRGAVDQIRDGDDDDSDGDAIGNAEYLNWFAGVIWKLGVHNIGAQQDEVCTLMCRLAERSDVTTLESDEDHFKPDARFEVEMYVRSLARINKERALEFVQKLSGQDYRAGDFGLFDEVLLDDPSWVLREVVAIRTRPSGRSSVMRQFEKYLRQHSTVSLEKLKEDLETSIATRTVAVQSHRLGAAGLTDDMSVRVAEFIRRIGKEAPQHLRVVWAALRENDDFRHDWVQRSVLTEAMAFAVSEAGMWQAYEELGEVPEFWGRSEVRAGAAEAAWAADPVRGLEMIDLIDVSAVKCRTIVNCAKKWASLGGRGARIAVLQGLLARCGELLDGRLRFEAARECVFCLYGISDDEDRADVIALAYKFLEMFTAAPIGWLSLAYLHAVPVLARYFDERALSAMGKYVFSPTTFSAGSFRPRTASGPRYDQFWISQA